MQPSKHFTNNQPKNTSAKSQVLGLDLLTKTLERDFFAEASIGFEVKDERIELVVHLNSNLALTESLFHLNNGTWGNFKSVISGGVKISPFHTTLLQLEQENKMPVVIVEMSVHLKDTSIILSRLPNCYIEDNLEGIFRAISENLLQFTQGMSQIPYEIFVPIYEESADMTPCINDDKYQKNSCYLAFWGLYFEGNYDAMVYDVKNKSIIAQSEFFLLNNME